MVGSQRGGGRKIKGEREGEQGEGETQYIEGRFPDLFTPQQPIPNSEGNSIYQILEQNVAD